MLNGEKLVGSGTARLKYSVVKISRDKKKDQFNDTYAYVHARTRLVLSGGMAAGVSHIPMFSAEASNHDLKSHKLKSYALGACRHSIIRSLIFLFKIKY